MYSTTELSTLLTSWPRQYASGDYRAMLDAHGAMEQFTAPWYGRSLIDARRPPGWRTDPTR
jgi:hypothetical protein